MKFNELMSFKASISSLFELWPCHDSRERAVKKLGVSIDLYHEEIALCQDNKKYVQYLQQRIENTEALRVRWNLLENCEKCNDKTKDFTLVIPPDSRLLLVCPGCLIGGLIPE